MEGPMAPTKMQTVTNDDTNETAATGLWFVTMVLFLVAVAVSFAPFITNVVH
jgi:hypothetical protein